MLYRTLGHTGTAVSAIALGTMDFGSLTSPTTPTPFSTPTSSTAGT